MLHALSRYFGISQKRFGANLQHYLFSLVTDKAISQKV
jgi:hypothetical protein